MGCQEPFYIGTSKLDSLKRIDALLNVRRNATPLCKMLLPLHIYFWLSAPQLSSFLPVVTPSIHITGGRRLYSRYLYTILLTHVCASLPLNTNYYTVSVPYPAPLLPKYFIRSAPPFLKSSSDWLKHTIDEL